MSASGVRRDKAAFSSGCKPHPATAPAGSNRSSHGGNEVAEAFGQRVTIYGDSASVQAVTRVNAEQASKRTMRRPTRLPFRGRLIGWVSEQEYVQPLRRGSGDSSTQGKRTQHGKPRGVVSDDQLEAREGQAGRPGVAERFVVPGKPGNAGGGKGTSVQDERNTWRGTWRNNAQADPAGARWRRRGHRAPVSEP